MTVSAVSWGELLDGGPAGRMDRWARASDRASDLADWLGEVDAATLARHALATVDYARARGPYALWLSAYERALETDLSPTERGALLLARSQVARERGLGDLALTSGRAAAALLTGSEAHVAHGWVVELLMDRGELDAAERTLVETVLDEGGAFDEDRGLALFLRAEIASQRGEPGRAIELLRSEALPGFEELGDRLSVAAIHGFIAQLEHRLGRTDEAIRRVRLRELPVLRDLHDTRGRAVALSSLASILADADRVGEAMLVLKVEVLPLFAAVHDAPALAGTHLTIAELDRARGRPGSALRRIEDQTLPALRELGDDELLAHAEQLRVELSEWLDR